LNNFNPNNTYNKNKLNNFYAYFLDLRDFVVNINSSDSLFISLCKPANYFENINKNSEYFYKSHLFVGKILDKEIEYLDDSYSNYYSSDIELKNIQPGMYIIFIHLDLDEIKENSNLLFDGYSISINLNKKIGILKFYSNQEFLSFKRLSSKDIDIHFTFDHLIYSLYVKKFSKVQKKRKFILPNDDSIYYSQYRINKYSKFIFFVFRNEKPNTQIILEFSIKNSLAICLSNFKEYNEKERKFEKLIPFDNTFLFTMFGGSIVYAYRHKILYSEEELKLQCKTKGTLKKISDIISYRSLINDCQVCFYFNNYGNDNYILTLNVKNFYDFENMGEFKKNYELYLIKKSDAYLILEFKDMMRFDNKKNLIDYGMCLQKM